MLGMKVLMEKSFNLIDFCSHHLESKCHLDYTRRRIFFSRKVVLWYCGWYTALLNLDHAKLYKSKVEFSKPCFGEHFNQYKNFFCLCSCPYKDFFSLHACTFLGFLLTTWVFLETTVLTTWIHTHVGHFGCTPFLDSCIKSFLPFFILDFVLILMD